MVSSNWRWAWVRSLVVRCGRPDSRVTHTVWFVFMTVSPKHVLKSLSPAVLLSRLSIAVRKLRFETRHARFREEPAGGPRTLEVGIYPPAVPLVPVAPVGLLYIPLYSLQLIHSITSIWLVSGTTGTRVDLARSKCGLIVGPKWDPAGTKQRTRRTYSRTRRYLHGRLVPTRSRKRAHPREHRERATRFWSA